MKGKAVISLVKVEGECPVCPRCKHHNAMLNHGYDYTDPLYFCRDCGHVQNWSGSYLALLPVCEGPDFRELRCAHGKLDKHIMRDNL